MAQSAKDIRINELLDANSQLNTTVKHLVDALTQKDKALADMQTRLDEMTEELKLLRKKLFGSSTEHMSNPYVNSDQLTIYPFLGIEPEKEPEPIEAEYIEIQSYTKSKKAKSTLKEQFSNIPVKQVFIDSLSDEDKLCPACGTEMQPIGTEIIRREVIHVKPSMYMLEYVGTTYGCPVCKDTEDPQFVKDNKAPAALIKGSYTSPSLASWILYEKFAKSVPFYRLEKSLEELGAKVSRTTMANWAIQCNSLYFKHLTDYFHRELLKRKYLMMDETPIQVLHEPGRTPESKSYVWLMRSGNDGLPPIIYYRYAPTRSGDVALELTDGIQPGTYLMCDGFSGYNKLKDVRRCTCYAHIRRYFYEAIPAGHDRDITNPAVQGVMYCNKLFSYENKYAERHYKPETIKKRRVKDEKPVIKAFLDWADKQVVTGNSKFSKALTYLKNRRNDLMTYLEDGHCSISNNWSENSIRPVTVGRKNWLFSSSVDGAEASMNIYTIIEMAKLHGLNRQKYLEYILEHRPSAEMTDEELSLLAPWNKDVQETCGKCDH
jgi:transposase